MKLFIYMFVVTFVMLGYLGCGNGAQKLAEMEPETIYSVKYIQKSDDWYKKQAQLWRKEIDRNPSNADAWYNYYKANRYAHFEDLKTENKQKLLNGIIDDMEKNVPESFEYNYLRGCHTPNKESEKRMQYLFNAYEKDPSRPEVYYMLIDYYDMRDDAANRRELYRKLYNSGDLAPGLLDYNYNVLMSLEPNGILITNGDNDTYPALLLQDVFDIRNDVMILNISWLKYLDGFLQNRLDRYNISLSLKGLPDRKNDSYLAALTRYFHENLPERPVYFALTVYQEFIRHLDGQLHIVGLVYQYNPERIDNIARIKKNLESNFRLDYLSYNWYDYTFPATSLMPQMNMNYVIPVLLLAEHYKISGDKTGMLKWKNLALKIGKDAGQNNRIEEYLKEKKL